MMTSLLPAFTIASDPLTTIGYWLIPNSFPNSDRIVIENFAPSKDDRYLAYPSTVGMEVTGERSRFNLPKEVFPPTEVLTGVKFSNVSWLNNGFFYKKYRGRGNYHRRQTLDSEVYYHRLFTEQEDDSLVFQNQFTL